MTTFTLIEIQHSRGERRSYISNVIAVYTDEHEANKEAEWRTRTSDPRLSENRYGYANQYMTHLASRDIEFRVLVTELITDKFTEFALQGTQNDS